MEKASILKKLLYKEELVMEKVFEENLDLNLINKKMKHKKRMLLN